MQKNHARRAATGTIRFGAFLIERIVTVREGEATTAVMMFAYSFMAMTAYNILKPVTRSQFISTLGADNLPYVQLGAGFLIGLMMQWYSKGTALLPRRSVIPVTLGVEALLLLGFWLLFRTGQQWVSVAFYVLALLLGILLTSQFWTLASDIYDARQARRLYGFIGGGASLGGAMGAGITSVVVHQLGTNNLLVVSACVLGLCGLLVAAIVRRVHGSGAAAAMVEERGVGGGEAIRLLRSSTHLQMIAILIGCAAIGAAIIEQQLNMAAEAATGGGTDAMTALLAQITFYLSIAGFVIQVALTSRVHRSLGLAVALLILPISLGATGALILVTGSLWAVGAARVLDTSLRYTIDKTTREVLFLPLSAELRYRAKPFVDVTVDRTSKAIGAVLVLVLIKPWGLGLGWRGLSFASLIVMVLWIIMAMRARREYSSAFRRSIEQHAIVHESLPLDAADASTVELLVEELAHPDPARVIYAIDVLEMLGKRNLITPLLLHHEAGDVRARALTALESRRMPARWLSSASQLLSDQPSSVRAAALHALASFHQPDAARLLRRHLADPEPRVAATAAVLLADREVPEDVGAGEAALKALIESDVAAVRREVAAVLSHTQTGRCRALLAALILDRDLEVARKAVRSAHMRTAEDVLLVPALIARLADRSLKAAARDALVSYGDHACEVLAHVMRDTEEQPWIRRHIPGTLARIQTEPSHDVLTAALSDRDGFLRFKALTALEHLRRDRPALRIRREVVELQIEKEARRYYASLHLQFDISRDVSARTPSLLERALQDKGARTADRIFRLLGLVYPAREIDAARRALRSREAAPSQTDRRQAIAAVEYFDNTLSHTLRNWLMPIIDEMPLSDRVRAAHGLMGTRPRELTKTIAQLLRDDDPVLAAAACLFACRGRITAVVQDLQYAQLHSDDRLVADAAGWTLESWFFGGADSDTLPTIELVDRLRAVTLFQSASVDELVRIAGAARRVNYARGDALAIEGTRADRAMYLLDGHVAVRTGHGHRVVRSPAAFGFEEMLERRDLPHTVTALANSTCLEFAGDELMAILSDDVDLLQGFFRTWLLRAERRGIPVHQGRTVRPESTDRGGSLKPIERLLVLEQNPLLTGLRVDHFLTVASLAEEVSAEAHTTLFEASDRPDVYFLLEGTLRLEGPQGQSCDAVAGDTIAILAALAGLPVEWRATVVDDIRALRVGREEMVQLLADDVELLRGLTSRVLGEERDRRTTDVRGALLQSVG